MNSFVGTLFIWLWRSNVKILITDVVVPGSNLGCEVYIFSCQHPWETIGSNLVFIVRFGTLCVELGN
jgi:hypothetical protein